MKIVLHIGTQKTGTTTFQQACIIKALDLRDLGILYPTFPQHSTQMELAARYYGANYQLIMSPFVQGPQEDVFRQSDANWALIEAEVAARPPQLLVLSSERFWETEDKAGFLGEIRRRFPQAQIEVVAYLREPVGFFVSLTQQRLKFRPDLRWPWTMGVGAHLAEWAELAPLTLRTFAPDKLINGDAVDDVLTHLFKGLLPKDVLAATRRNDSLSTESLIVLGEILAHQVDRSGPIDRTPIISAIRMLALAETKMPADQPLTKLTLKPGMEREILKAAKPDLVTLRDRLGFTFDGIAIDDLPEGGADPTRWVAFDAVFETNPERLAQFRAALTMMLVRNVTHLRGKVAKLTK